LQVSRCYDTSFAATTEGRHKEAQKGFSEKSVDELSNVSVSPGAN